ncbi:hypothetical protein [Sporolactobacillus terrae]|uniref:hypothetical protein n=1 Tax=Sporolactobacillus terrae TaxID=269673 RepID=UPI00048E8FF5|nr:hypothetical protein [Sporolactobacillus terrae]
MFDAFNQELQEIKEQVKNKKKWEAQLARLKDETQQQEQKWARLQATLTKEQKDVTRMESLSVPSILYTLIGRKLEKIDKEKQEAITAQLKEQEARRTLEDMKKEQAELVEKLKQVAGADTRYEAWMQHKEQLIHDTASPISKALYQLLDQEADLRAGLKEHKEAIAAGQQAHEALEHAQASLNTAKNWSNLDLFGGGFISTAMKHERMDGARGDIHDAQQALRRFEKELSDVTGASFSELESNGLLTFADYFFDNVVTDWMVHTKIQKSSAQIERILQQIAQLLDQLRQQSADLKKKLEETEKRRTKMIENY